MLVLPVERELNWRRPAWMTLLLMLLNLLVFTFYQGDDDALFHQAIERYLAADLDRLEQDVYENYLQRDINLHGADRAEDLAALREARTAEDRGAVSALLLMDLDFVRYARENTHLYWQPEQVQLWQRERPLVDELLAQTSLLRSGLMPADLQASSLITYAFLHGGWAHLLGNLLFLFILGFTVEQALGPARYLLAYLLCGALSGLGFALLEGDSHTPLVGASGAISGLMGMYVAMYGLQKIRFFYFVGVYFDYFRAPALVMLPIWLGKELYDYWAADATRIAYMAHFFGLLAGAALVWLFGRSWLQVQETFYEPTDTEQEEIYRKAYAQAMKALARLEVEPARAQFERLWERYPEHLHLLEHLYHLAALNPQSEPYQARTTQLLAEQLRRNLFSDALAVYQAYHKRAGEHASLAADTHQRMMFACLRHDAWKDAEKAFERLRRAGSGLLTVEACRLMAVELGKRGQAALARHYRELLGALEAGL